MNPVGMYFQSIIRAIEPFDAIETMHQIDALTWIGMGAPIFRITKPDTPPKHLVAYFVVYDEQHNKLLLVDHIKAQAWLPPGGHVEHNEDPQFTVQREAQEELGLAADFGTRFGKAPLFITVTRTRGPGVHTDVSLWYVIRGNSTTKLTFDTNEMRGYQWLTPEGILSLDIARLDPHMHRFVRKMQKQPSPTSQPDIPALPSS